MQTDRSQHQSSVSLLVLSNANHGVKMLCIEDFTLQPHLIFKLPGKDMQNMKKIKGKLLICRRLETLVVKRVINFLQKLQYKWFNKPF